MAGNLKTQAKDPAKVVVDFPGRDRIEARGDGAGTRITVYGSRDLKSRIQSLQQAEKDPARWALPGGTSPSELLIKEFILKLRGEWSLPYKDEELCHCRNVPTAAVDQAILAGAHTCARVSSRTSASTSCGTCRPDVQKMIDYRLKTG